MAVTMTPANAPKRPTILHDGWITEMALKVRLAASAASG